MSDSAGGGESGGVAGAGQDAEADNEPPQQAPPLPEGDGLEAVVVEETSEDGTPPSAKRLRMSEEEEQEPKPAKVLGETPAQTGFLQEDAHQPAQGEVSAAVHVSNKILRKGRYISRKYFGCISEVMIQD